MAPYDVDDDSTDKFHDEIAGLIDDVASQSYDIAIGIGLGTLLLIGAWFARDYRFRLQRSKKR